MLHIYGASKIHITTNGGELITPELQNLCAAAEEYLKVEWGGAPGEPLLMDEGMTCSAITNENDGNLVPPAPDEVG